MGSLEIPHVCLLCWKSLFRARISILRAAEQQLRKCSNIRDAAVIHALQVAKGDTPRLNTEAQHLDETLNVRCYHVKASMQE